MRREGNTMQIKQAKMDDLNQIMEILRDGRNQLAEQGIDQWQGDYPNEEHIKEDIEKGFAYLVQSQDDEIVGALSIVEAPDHSDDELNGDWLIDTDRYVVIHRVAIHSNHAGKGYENRPNAFWEFLKLIPDGVPPGQEDILEDLENDAED